MKVITSTTIRINNKEGKREYLPPGEHDLDDAVAEDLLAKGVAQQPTARVATDGGIPEGTRARKPEDAKSKKAEK